MKNLLLQGAIAISILVGFAAVYASSGGERLRLPVLGTILMPEDTTKKLPYPISKTGEKKGAIDLNTPPAVEKSVELDSSMDYYKVSTKVGDASIGSEEYVPFEEYLEQENQEYIQDYFKKRSLSQATTVQGRSVLPSLDLGEGILDDIAGAIDIRPQGSAEVIFSEDIQRVQNPNWPIDQQRNAQFKFDQKIQVSVLGSIGDKIQLGINYDTEASFDFENQRKLNYVGKEDEIIRSIEIGDVTMPVSGSLISGSQSLFGIKTQLQFGKLDVTSVFSQQKSEKKVIEMEDGAQRTEFNIPALEYDNDRHFFLAQYFYEHYNEFNRNWPALSNIQITRVEVWVMNTTVATQNARSVAAFADLGEKQPYKGALALGGGPNFPSNGSNNLYTLLNSDPDLRYERSFARAIPDLGNLNLRSNIDYFEISNARMLAPNDFTINPKLGYISLNSRLNQNEVLAVAFEYTVNGIRYQVGEFGRDVPPDNTNNNLIFLKLLKTQGYRPDLPLWHLMMKNIYSLGAYQVTPEDFRLQVVYANDQGVDLNYLPVPSEPELNGKPLIRVLDLDRFNTQQELKPDGSFDYLEGVTITSGNGRVIFPVVEPFGDYLRTKFNDKNLADRFAYDELYDSTIALAQQETQKNKFFLRGSYQGASGAVISLNAINVPQGSVKVTAGGIPLAEGIDYTVDYTLGRVTIINDAILNSGAVIRVEAETNTFFNIQQKTLMGTRLNYNFTKDIALGGTLLYLKERPLTPKQNVGDEPIRNAIWGLDGRFRTDSRFLTKLIDKAPLLETKEMSEIAFEGEFAKIEPGHPKQLNDPLGNGNGVSYLDDFEGSLAPYDLRLDNRWYLAAVPQGQPEKFPNALSDTTNYNFGRARLSWYLIDNTFHQDNNLTPENIRGNKAMLSNHYMREVYEWEVFPNRQIPTGSPGILRTWDLAYRPSERGPYNYTLDRLDADGNLIDPQNSWAGVTRSLQINDFEASNVEFITFWVMDPFIYDDQADGGDLYFNIGTISEDILRDNRKLWENGLPTTATPQSVDTTSWGRVPNGPQVVTAFANDPAARPFQDVGYDGLTDADESSFYNNYLNQLQTKLNPNVYQRFADDPSADNFRFFRGQEWDDADATVLTRYKYFNNPHGNTPTEIEGDNGYGAQSPDDEDINGDFNLEKTEDYYEYRVSIRPKDMVVGRNYITDKQTSTVQLRDGSTDQVTWYQFKIPVQQYDRRVGSIRDFRSIRFMRLYLKDFSDSVILRFGQLQLVRGDWRKYRGDLREPGDFVPRDSGATTFEVAAVNIEENGKRPDMPYVLPPGIQREIDYNTPNLVQQNEQSLSLEVCNLEDGDARAIFKNLNYDIRQYKRLKMFVHAENLNNELQDGDLHLFIRIGTDYEDNYYEYQLPLKFTMYPAFSQDQIWPEENRIDLLLENLYQVKKDKIASGAPFYERFSRTLADGSIVTVVGNPDLSNVRSVMFGLRNPKDDGRILPCAEVWINELRVTDFNEKGGWAAIGRMTTKLADFGRLELTGSRTTIGFGGLEETLQQRSQEDSRYYGLISTFQLGNFFPKSFNIKIPMLFSYSEQINRPRFNPLSPDLPLNSIKDMYDDPAVQDSIMEAAEDFTARTSLNFTGVQKLRAPNKKAHFYDVENLNGTYVFSKIDRHNIYNVYDIEKQHVGQLGYSYSFNPKPVTPFKKVKGKYLKPVSDFNFYYLPQSVVVRGELNRWYSEKLFRATDDIQTIAEPLYDKNFIFNRSYDVRHNITRGLRIIYGSKASSRIEEPYGPVDKAAKDTIWQNLLKLGDLTTFNQQIQAAYDVPLNKIPVLDWTTVQASYTANYQWDNAPPAAVHLGNTAQNSQTINLVGQFNFSNLYRKVGFLKDLQTTSTPGRRPQPQAAEETEEEEEEEGAGAKAGKAALGLITSLKNANFKYTINDGILLPGFLPTPDAFGQDFGAAAPGLPFILGSQQDIRQKAANSGWLTSDTNMTSPYIETHREEVNLGTMFEPLKFMRLNIDFNKRESSTFTENWRAVDASGKFEHLAPVETGSYTISYLMWNTAFAKGDSANSSPTFSQFEQNRIVIADRLAQDNPNYQGGRDANGFPIGYGRYQQDVLIPAFLAAYSGKDPSKVTTSPFINIPKPNWNLSYTGLSNIGFIKEFARSVNMTHGYSSTYTVDQYSTALDYDPNAVPTPGQDLVSQYRIERVTIAERFQPLFGFDINWVNGINTRFEYRRDRSISMSFADKRVSEISGKEFTFRAGYRTNKFYLPFKIDRKKVFLPNDLQFNLDMSIRDNKQLIRILDKPADEATAFGGQRVFSLTPNITYVLSQNLTLNIFFRRNSTRPYTSNQYPTSLTSVGFSLRYVLAP